MSEAKRRQSLPPPHDIVTPSGMVAHFYPAYYELQWGQFGGPLTYMQARTAAASLLTTSFLEQTFNGMRRPNLLSAREAHVVLLQHGRKNAVYGIHVGDRSFIFTISRGTSRLQQEVEMEYENLRSLRQKLREAGLPVFVPQSFAVVRGEAVSGFSIEYLSQHFEMQADGRLVRQLPPLDRVKYHTTFKMVSDDPKAKHFNDFIERNWQRWVFSKRAKKNDPNYRIKIELIARLFLTHAVTGCIPAEFSVKAGDFMADIRKPDYDLRLITVRGGWRGLSFDQFRSWLMEVEFSQGTPEEIAAGLQRPLFDFDPVIIKEGLQRGKRIFTTGAGK